MSTEPEPISALAERALARAGSSPPRPVDPEAIARSARRAEATRIEVARLRLERFEEEIPARFRGARLVDLPEPRLSEISSWLADPRGRNLVLAGPVGCGKTHALAAAARQTAEDGLHPWLISAVELLEQLRPGGDPVALDRASSCGILGLDDLGAERASDWTAERLAFVIDRRWLEERPIMASTNLTLGPSGELIEALGERSYSRLVGSGAVVLQLQGADRRRTR